MRMIPWRRVRRAVALSTSGLATAGRWLGAMCATSGRPAGVYQGCATRSLLVCQTTEIGGRAVCSDRISGDRGRNLSRTQQRHGRVGPVAVPVAIC
jgi:hypothetical protein